MIRNLMILNNTSGIVLFEKDWVSVFDKKSKQMYGGLFTSIQVLAKQSTGMPVTYIEFSAVSVSVAHDDRSRVSCYLFHDRETGQEFGALITNQLLREFVDNYFTESSRSNDPSRFQGFAGKLSDVISNSSKVVLDQLQLNRAIHSTLLIHEDRLQYSTGSLIEDPLSMVAHLQELLGSATDLMQTSRDTPQELTLELSEHVVHVCRAGVSSLLVALCRKPIDPTAGSAEAVRSAVTLLEQVLELKSNLQGQNRTYRP